MKQSNEYSNINKEYQAIPNDYIPNWRQLSPGFDNTYQQDISKSDSMTDQTTSFGFQLQDENRYQYNQQFQSEEINPEMDYETLIRKKDLYFDPDPKIIRKPTTEEPVVYNQNIMVRFLQPPPIQQGPLIIREVRPPQPPPPPPLVIRQRAPPPLSPPPIILRERPPPIPAIMTAQVITKPLPPLPPPPRSVIIERIPSLPPKPRDIIIERWVPYESTQKRKVIVQRAEGAKSYPKPKNVIITYEPVQARVIRHFERVGITQEDPRNYSALYGNSLLDTEQLLAQIRELGIIEDISPPKVFTRNQQTPCYFNEQNYGYNTSSQETQTYAPTFENLMQVPSSSINYFESHDQHIGHLSPNVDDLSSQLAQYGLTKDSIPY